MLGLNYDMIEERAVPGIQSKSACGSGQFVANGLIWRIPSGVGHIAEWRGFNVRGPAETDLPAAGFRLEQNAPPAEPNTGGAGWGAYRANNARSASVAVEVPATAAMAWHVPASDHPVQKSPGGGVLLGPRIVPVPPVTSGNTVVVASRDGTIQALDLQTGRPLWRALTGGRIQSPPTIWNDRVYAGSADGCVYAFALEDGRQLWRLRVASEAGRMMLFDQLGSRWPVLCSPMVADGKVFAAAGYMECLDGLCVAAADAETGEILWERTDWTAENGETLSPDRTLGGTGQFCWDDETGELVYSAGEAVPLRFSPSDGTARAAYAHGRIQETAFTRHGRYARDFRRISYGAGQDVGKFGSGWLVLGGARMMVDGPAWNANHKSERFIALDENGDGLFPVLGVGNGELVPAWDAKDVFFAFDQERAVVFAMAPITRAKEALENRAAAEGEDLGSLIRGVDLNNEELLTWQVKLRWGSRTSACALTANAALALTGTHRGAPYKLRAFNRADGEQLWQVELPEAPIYNGLAVSDDGRAIVVLSDGSVLCVGPGETPEPAEQ
jgi:outer membrane protein assembly factor BamB